MTPRPNHIEGHPISATTYRYHKCRCDACTAAAAAAIRQDRQKRDGALIRVDRRTERLAAAWVRKNHHDQWESFRQQAYDDLGIKRRPPGRPRANA